MKKKATKLLAVVAFAASPAIVSADPRPSVDTTTAVNTTANVVAEESPTNWNASVSIFDTFAVLTARPRQMPTGAPACGNVASRAPRPASCEPASASAPILATTNDGAATPIARRAQIATRSRVMGDRR